MTAELIEDRERPGHFRVEAFDEDGACELSLFSGPNAKERAIIFAGTYYEKWGDPEALAGI